MQLTYYLLLITILLVGWFVNILGLPGLWLMVIAFVGYGLATGWGVFVGWPATIAMLGLTLSAEAVEFLAGAAGSAAAGGRKRSMVGAIVGGFLGGIAGTPLLPVIGTIVGACAGAFLGAAVMELRDKGAIHSFHIGVGAAKGRFLGIVCKLMFGLVMFVVAAWTGWPG